MNTKQKSNGTVGESFAMLSVFPWMEVDMDRSQPETRTVYKIVYGKKVPTVINYGTGGIADYVGLFTRNGEYCAAEVKEYKGDSMPCSVLSTEQRAWMSAKSKITIHLYVVVFWMDINHASVFKYKPKGSYKKGEELWVI